MQCRIRVRHRRALVLVVGVGGRVARDATAVVRALGGGRVVVAAVVVVIVVVVILVVFVVVAVLLLIGVGRFA